MKMRLMYKLQKHIKKSHIEMAIDRIVLDVMENNGFDRDQVREQVEKNRHNVMTTTYYLLLKKRLRMLKEYDDDDENFKNVRLDMAIVIDAEMVTSINDDQRREGEEEEKKEKTDFEKKSSNKKKQQIEDKDERLGTPDEKSKKLATSEYMKSRNKKNKAVSVQESTPVKERSQSKGDILDESAGMKRTISSKNLSPGSKLKSSRDGVNNENFNNEKKDDIFSTLENVKDISRDEELTISNIEDLIKNEDRIPSPMLEKLKQNHKKYKQKTSPGKPEFNPQKSKPDSISHKKKEMSSKKSNNTFEKRRISGLNKVKETQKNWSQVNNNTFFRNRIGKTQTDRFIKTSNKKNPHKRTIKSIKSDKDFRKKINSKINHLESKLNKKKRPKSPSLAVNSIKWSTNVKNTSKTLKPGQVYRQPIGFSAKKNSLVSAKDQNNQNAKHSILLGSETKQINSGSKTYENPFKSKIKSTISNSKRKSKRKNTDSHLIKYKKDTGKRSPLYNQNIKTINNNNKEVNESAMNTDSKNIKSFFRVNYSNNDQMKTERFKKKKKIEKGEGGSDGLLTNPRKVKNKLENTENEEKLVNKSPHNFSKKRKELMMLMKGKPSKPESRIKHKKRDKLSISVLNKNFSYMGHNFDQNNSNYMGSIANSTYITNFHYKDSSRDDVFNSSRAKNKKKKYRKRLKIKGKERINIPVISSVKVSPKGNTKLNFKNKKLTYDRIEELKYFKRKRSEENKPSKEIYMSLLLNEDKKKLKKSPLLRSPVMVVSGNSEVRDIKTEIREHKRNNSQFNIDLSTPFFDHDSSDFDENKKNGPLSLDYLMVLEGNQDMSDQKMAKMIEESEIPLPEFLKEMEFKLLKPISGGDCVVTCSLSNRKKLNLEDPRIARNYVIFENRLREVF